MHSCIFLHVENVARVNPTFEVEGTEEEYQEQQQELEVDDPAEEQDPKANFANTDPQQGKHRFIYPSILHRFKFMQAPVHLIPSLYTSPVLCNIYFYTYALRLQELFGT